MLQVLAEIRTCMYYIYQHIVNYLLSDDRVDVFTVTCGRSGVGSITSVELHIDGTNGWYATWIEVSDGSDTYRFEVNDWLDEYDTKSFQRN